jgi:hypothetical protein
MQNQSYLIAHCGTVKEKERSNIMRQVLETLLHRKELHRKSRQSVLKIYARIILHTSANVGHNRKRVYSWKAQQT